MRYVPPAVYAGGKAWVFANQLELFALDKLLVFL